MSNTQSDSQPLDGMARANSALSQLFRTMLVDIRIDIVRYATLMTRYLDCPAHGFPSKGRARKAAKDRINALLRNPDFTWDDYQFALTFLNAGSQCGDVRFSTELFWPNGRSSIHTIALQDISGTSPEWTEADRVKWLYHRMRRRQRD